MLHEINIRKAFAAMGTDRELAINIDKLDFIDRIEQDLDGSFDQHATQQMIFETQSDNA